MAYQFIHVEVYARKTPKKRQKDKWSVQDIINEAERKEGHCNHVENPRPPTILLGRSPSEIGVMATERAYRSVDAMGRRMRADAGCLIAGVVTHPREVNENLSTKEKKKEYLEWESETIKFLKEEYGDNLKSVIRHFDEKHPHIHFYVVPDLTKDNKLNIDKLHHGLKAKAKAKEEGKSKYDQRADFSDAMRNFQTKYYEKVSIYFGHGRIGPKRRRLGRAAWAIEVQNNHEVGLALRNAKEINRIEFEKSRKEADRIKKKAIEEAKRKLRDADRKAANIVNLALQKATRIKENSRNLGGWIHAVISGFSKKEKEIERQIKEREERKRREIEEEANKAKNLAALQANSTRILKKEIEILKDQNSDLSKKNEHLSSQIPQDPHEYQRDARNELKR